MTQLDDFRKIRAIKQSAVHLHETGDDYRALLDAIGDRSLVLLGEGTHGSHEFYRERAQISKILIREKGFKAIAIEGDWPDAYRVNQFVLHRSADLEASDALSGFSRFPSWMWANADVLDFVGWLRAHNDQLPVNERSVGFYGLDLYSLHRSTQEVINYLDRVDPAAAEHARTRYACFDRFGGDPKAYAYATGLGVSRSCEEEVVQQLVELLKNRAQYRTHLDGELAEDEYFSAEQNTRVVEAAERYYRLMLRADVPSWNLRDEHMFETLSSIREHLIYRDHAPKIIVWAHNSHLGDARATDMSKRGELNLGQLVRESFAGECYSVGFTTYSGTVTAASNWEGTAERKTVRPALDGSYENLFHQTGISRFFLDLQKKGADVVGALKGSMLERAIGVLYLPQTERQSHYFNASLANQFDGVIHIDHTRAVEPLEHRTKWQTGAEVPEAFPTGA